MTKETITITVMENATINGVNGIGVDVNGVDYATAEKIAKAVERIVVSEKQKAEAKAKANAKRKATLMAEIADTQAKLNALMSMM